MKGKRKVIRFINVVLLVLLAFIAIFPLLWAVSASLRPDTEMFQYISPLQWHTFIPVDFTIGAYVTIFTKYAFWEPLLRSMVVSIVIVVIGCLLNSLAAFGFSCFDFKGKKLCFGIIMFSVMIPFESICVPLYQFATKLKWVDTYQGLIVPCIADGFTVFLFVQFFKNISKTFFEAARIDGASWLRVYSSIVVPISKPIFITAALVTFINQWSSFLWPLLVAYDKDMVLVQIALSQFKGEHKTLWSCMYAASIVTAIVPLTVFLPLQKYYVEGITAGGIKG